jgi:hypothetical protein
VLATLRTEFARTLALLGASSSHDLDRSWVQTPASWDAAVNAPANRAGA